MSNPYAGTQTEKNLEAAFAGESQARNKYTYFASVAKKEGYEQISALFGSASVRMENDGAIRIHAATDQALYEVLLPRSLSAETGNICRVLLLYAAETHE